MNTTHRDMKMEKERNRQTKAVEAVETVLRVKSQENSAQTSVEKDQFSLHISKCQTSREDRP